MHNTTGDAVDVAEVNLANSNRDQFPSGSVGTTADTLGVADPTKFFDCTDVIPATLVHPGTPGGRLYDTVNTGGQLDSDE